MTKDEYKELLKDEAWKAKRLRILERDRHTCKNCSKKGGRLEVHHLYYLSGRLPWQYPNSALVSLCPDCHHSEHAGKENADFTKKAAKIKKYPEKKRSRNTPALSPKQKHIN